MIKPLANEKLKDFVDRCIPLAIDSGQAANKKQATALAYSLFRKAHKPLKLDAGFGHDVAQLIVPGSTWACSEASTSTYRKELIKVGTYTKGETSFTVTQALVEHWAVTGNEMLEAGMRIPITGADHVVDESNSYGFVKAFEVDGESLYGIMDVVEVSEEALDKLIKTNDISIYSPAEYVGSNGIKYTRPITSVALTPVPVVTGLGDFEAIAASYVEPVAASEDTAVETTPVPATAQQELENEPTETKKEILDMDITKIAEALKMSVEDGTELTEEMVLKCCAELMEKIAASELAVETAKLEADKLVAAANEDAASKLQQATEAIAASHKTSAPDPRLVKAVHGSTMLRIDNLVQGGNISRAAGERMKARLDESSLALSVATNTDRTVEDLLTILSCSRPVSFGEKTPMQVLENPAVGGKEGQSKTVADVARSHYNR